MTFRRMLTGAAALLVVGCSAAGPYGYSRTYAPTDAEETAAVDARELDLVMAARRPKEWSSRPVSMFGVVSNVEPGPGASWSLEVTLRRLQKRNLCREAAEDSCRVTVSEKAFASVRVQVKLTKAELTGPNQVRAGSLIRVIGDLKPAKEDSEEKPTILSKFHRHWPQDQYVTTAFRKYLRR